MYRCEHFITHLPISTTEVDDPPFLPHLPAATGRDSHSHCKCINWNLFPKEWNDPDT